MITEGHIARHYQGQRGGRGPALIDIAQDHLLTHLASEGVFELGIALKGGTSIRKFRAGSQGRFSTDLDFAGLDDASAEILLDLVDDATIGPFTFGIEPLHDTLRARLRITCSYGDAEGVLARLDLGRRPLWLQPERLDVIPLPIHRVYGFTVPPIPVARVEEVISEKLARYRRHSLARDLYDLAWFAERRFDESAVREMTVLKVWSDVVLEGLGDGPFSPAQILRERQEPEFEAEAIGYLTRPVRMQTWIETVRKRFAFLDALQPDQVKLCQCSRGDQHLFEQHIDAVRRS